MITVLVIHQKLEGVTSLSGCAQTWLSGNCKKAFWKARPDFWVAGLWLLDVRVVSLCPYLLNFAPSPWLDHGVCPWQVGPTGSDPALGLGAFTDGVSTRAKENKAAPVVSGRGRVGTLCPSQVEGGECS